MNNIYLWQPKEKRENPNPPTSGSNAEVLNKLPETEKDIPMPPVKPPKKSSINEDGKIVTNSLNKYYESKEIKEFEDALYNGSLKDRMILIEDIDEDTGVAVDNFIRFWNHYDNENNIPIEEREPIKVAINSPGGLLSSTMTIIDSIQLSKTPVWTINLGCAYSGGFFIFIVGYKRIAYPNSTFLYHEGSGGASGDANKFQNQADFYKRQRSRIKDLTLKYTKIPEELYDEHIKDDWWLFADEAIELGIADEIAKTLV